MFHTYFKYLCVGRGGGGVICFLNHFANLNHPKKSNVITIISHTATEKEEMPACAIFPKWWASCTMSNLLCVLLVGLGMFFSFLNDGCQISCTIFLGPPTLAGCTGQDPTNRIWPAWNNLVHHQGEPKKDNHQHHLGTATRPSHSGIFCSFRGPQIFAKKEKPRTQRLKMRGESPLHKNNNGFTKD